MPVRSEAYHPWQVGLCVSLFLLHVFYNNCIFIQEEKQTLKKEVHVYLSHNPLESVDLSRETLVSRNEETPAQLGSWHRLALGPVPGVTSPVTAMGGGSHTEDEGSQKNTTGFIW